MQTKAFSFFLIIILSGCEITESQNPPIFTLEDELKEVLAMPLVSPSGKLSKVVTYGGNSDKVYGSIEIYYPAIGNISVHIQQDQNQDTLGITLNYFSGEQLETSHFFQYQEGKANWFSSREIQLTSENLLDKIFLTSENRERSLLAQYHYNSQNQLVQVEYPNENGAALEVYEYDEFGRISKEWKSAMGQEEFKIDYLVYRYNDDLLVAKESGIRGTITDEREDAFQYFYDSEGKLIIQKEYDPYFGFQQKSRTEYFYH